MFKVASTILAQVTP